MYISDVKEEKQRFYVYDFFSVTFFLPKDVTFSVTYFPLTFFPHLNLVFP